MEDKRVRIVNLTGHPLVLGSNAYSVRFKSEGRMRLDTRYEQVDTLVVDGVDGDTFNMPLLKVLNGDYSGVPKEREGTLYVVSGLVAGRLKRPDIVAPARLHRENGRVQYARALLRYTP